MQVITTHDMARWLMGGSWPSDHLMIEAIRNQLLRIEKGPVLHG